MGKDAKFVVRLDAEERQQLQGLIRQGGRAAAVLKRARVLLQADQSQDGPAWPDHEVARFAQVGLSTVHRVRQRFVEEGFDVALFRKTASDRLYRKLDGAGEARLIATACSQPPQGRSRWTLHLLADRLVALQVVHSISHECVRGTLKKTRCSRI